jgi:hypothetical protein
MCAMGRDSHAKGAAMPDERDDDDLPSAQPWWWNYPEEIDEDDLDDDGNLLPFDGPEEGPTKAEIDAWLIDRADMDDSWTKGVNDTGGYIANSVGRIICYAWVFDTLAFYRATAPTASMKFTRPTGPPPASPTAALPVPDPERSDGNSGQ